MPRYLIDYVSYTFYSQALYDPDRGDVQTILKSDLPEWIDRNELVLSMSFGKTIKRAGFDAGVNIDNHTFIFWNLTGLILIEHTGRGCDDMRERGYLERLLNSEDYNFTRIDIAHDIETDVRPPQFVDARESKSQRASGYQISDSGETCYIGSKKSDRTCKVYRYNPPHPRSHLLRIEYTYRGKQANEISKLYREGKTVETLASMSGMRYGWKHPDYTAQASAGSIKAWRPDRKSGKTVRWLYAQCAPALAKLIKEDAISLDEFIEYVTKLLTDDEL